MLMLKPISLGAAALTFLTCAAHAQEAPSRRPQAEVALSNDTLQVRYVDSGARVNAQSNSQVSGAFFLSEDRDIVLSGDLLFPVDIGFRSLDILIGPRVYAALLDEENNDILAMSLGTELRWTLDSRSRLAVAGHAFYSPDILTFGTADNLTDLMIRAELGVAPQLIVFGGMRWFEFDLIEGAGEQTLQEELFVGAGYRF
jgi:hypothetical protein